MVLGEHREFGTYRGVFFGGRRVERGWLERDEVTEVGDTVRRETFACRPTISFGGFACAGLAFCRPIGSYLRRLTSTYGPRLYEELLARLFSVPCASEEQRGSTSVPHRV